MKGGFRAALFVVRSSRDGWSVVTGLAPVILIRSLLSLIKAKWPSSDQLRDGHDEARDR
jgi:hypothetical protein